MLNSLPPVSVIIPVYNGETDLPDLIDCLYKQTYPSNLVEYLLVDNNSRDRTANLLQDAEKEANSKGINFYHLTEKEIQSSYAARNLGIRKAKNDILVFTDADCRPKADWLEKIVQPFINSEVGIVAGEILAYPGKTLLEKYSDRHHLLSQKFLIEHPFCPYGQTANLAIRKKAFIDVGLFRPYLTTGGDADICWRIQKEGNWKLEYVPEAIVKHRHRSNLKNFRSQFRRYGSSNRYLHELYGVNLMRELTAKETFYRLSRWLIKELPRDIVKAIALKADLVDLVNTPIDLIGFQARTIGQKESKLSEAARQIEWF
jgi:cellulose synthase/poly-beta-1,6-N-acetylglucosamine synthase-like glycosyltransferase